ncbi:hypothetical protein MAPG_04183 [Magnaporthiopsis poae ATCC 64411]|uniref:Uncharacterized protein n=1 Tax=Magnaporthiopsis poae (strain ATCC 64411 / 73-15) TaxID=644358 RepID=A0A0C4DW15_MAGP6|nr:hypothetical protein MAPG_04183 [Magnaporthiopsis poae ATCC 64411]
MRLETKEGLSGGIEDIIRARTCRLTERPTAEAQAHLGNKHTHTFGLALTAYCPAQCPAAGQPPARGCRPRSQKPRRSPDEAEACKVQMAQE